MQVRLLAIALVGAAALLPAAARAELFEAEFHGIVTSGADLSGYYLPAGTNLVGHSWSMNFIYNPGIGINTGSGNTTDLYGGPGFGAVVPPNPLSSVSFTLDGNTFFYGLRSAELVAVQGQFFGITSQGNDGTRFQAGVRTNGSIPGNLNTPFSTDQFTASWTGEADIRASICGCSGLVGNLLVQGVTVDQIDLPNLVITGFGDLSSHYAAPSSGLNAAQFATYQQSELQLSDNLTSYIAAGGNALAMNVLNVDPGELVETLSDVTGVIGSLIGGDVDPFLPLFVCPTSCSVPLLAGSAYTISDPYDVMSYDVPVIVDAKDLALLTVGQRFFIHSGLFGDNAFSTVTVNSISGNNVNLRFQEIADVPDTSLGVPEPSTWALMIMGFGGIGASLRRRRLVAG